MLTFTLSNFSKLYNKVINNKIDYFLYDAKQNKLMEDSIFLDSIYPGSFNPLHDGHKEIINKILETGEYFAVEISISRIGKGNYTSEQLYEIVSQFYEVCDVIITNYPFFVQKASIPSCDGYMTIYIGYDTYMRMYKQHGKAFLQGINATFYVIPRVIEGKMKGLVQNKLVPDNFLQAPFKISFKNSSLSSSKLRNE